MKSFRGVFPVMAMALMLSLVIQANGQGQAPTPPTSPCTAAMLSSFNPCIGYLTNGNGTSGSPTSDCCNSLRSLMSNGTECLCQIVTGGIPFRIPLNRTSAISLPKACNQPGVPVQCKAATGAPVPAPGPSAFTPSASPAAAVSPTPSGGSTPSLGPVSDTTPGLTPTTPEGSTPPSSTNTGTGAVTPSAAVPSLSLSPSFLLLPVALMVIKYF